MNSDLRAAPPVNGLNVEAYADNVLIEACGPILSPLEMGKRLLHLPPKPTAQEIAAPNHLKLHYMQRVWQLHLPMESGIELAQSVGVVVRQCYLHRCPTKAKTWEHIYNPSAAYELSPVQLAIAVIGVSGGGKSQALERALALMPQVVVHQTFPQLLGAVRQLLWLKVDVPASGRLSDLVEAFAYASDKALGTAYAADISSGRRRKGLVMASEWLARMACHFPGVIVLDELQNLFKVETREARTQAGRKGMRPPLRVVEDEALKFVLTITNTTKIPFIGCGTYDALAALQTRMSTSQRLISGGFHRFDPDQSATHGFFGPRLLPTVLDYQWLPERLELSNELAETAYRLTAGIPRIFLRLWIEAQRRALAVKARRLSVEHLRYAAAHALAPVQPAVNALLSGDQKRLMLYEDLLPQEFG